MTRFGLFLSSYAPLLVILAVRFDQLWLQAACAAGALVGLALAFWILKSHRDATSVGAIEVEKAEDAGDLATSYLISYLLPFVAVDQPGIRDVIAYLIFFAVLALVYVRSDMILINPVLYVRRRLVKITTKGGRTLYAIANRRIIPGVLRGVEITPGIFLVTEDAVNATRNPAHMGVE